MRLPSAPPMTPRFQPLKAAFENVVSIGLAAAAVVAILSIIAHKYPDFWPWVMLSAKWGGSLAAAAFVLTLALGALNRRG